jgi:hypothetical protein
MLPAVKVKDLQVVKITLPVENTHAPVPLGLKVIFPFVPGSKVILAVNEFGDNIRGELDVLSAKRFRDRTI